MYISNVNSSLLFYPLVPPHKLKSMPIEYFEIKRYFYIKYILLLRIKTHVPIRYFIGK